MISKGVIQKWIRMLQHKSVLHVEQKEGKYYSVQEIAGYYNDFCEKVQNTKTYDVAGVPLNVASYGNERKEVYFSIAIFQYGLGAYDLWIETKKEVYYNSFLKMADWAVENQEHGGAWNTFDVLHYSSPYSSMAQGEGASLLARAYKETLEQKYYIACEKAIDFMLLPTIEGGTSQYTASGLILKEYPDKATVLNGWIFSAFGLLDAWKMTGKNRYYEAWHNATNEIKHSLYKFDAGYWSYYDLNGTITSPFYHSLHIELLKALNNLRPDEEYKKYIDKWNSERDNWFGRKMAFVLKAKQKLTEEKTSEWTIVG